MTIDELEQIAETETESCQKCPNHLHVCVAAGCISSQSEQVKESLEREIKGKGLEDRLRVKGVGCMGLCAAGPLVSHPAKSVMYQGVKPSDATDIVTAVETGAIVKALECPTHVPFFTRQTKIVLENSGTIDPERIEEYIAAQGYVALHKSLTGMSRPEVVEQVSRSGLRGRGGAGFATGLKWSMVAKAGSTRKYVICNADEGDPGAFMDRSVLESDPHRVLEGMAIAAYAVGADHGFIYVRSEYPLAVQRLKVAIRQA
jgi:bidirectional [NiFe] hydrogenase diaphorase subunit